MCWIQGPGFVVYSFWQCCGVQSLWLWQGLSLSVSNSKWVSGRSLSPPAGRLEYCCGKSFLWATCHTRVKPTRRSWSLSPVVGGWILLKAALDQCEYWEDVHQSLMQWQAALVQWEWSFLFCEPGCWCRQRAGMVLAWLGLSVLALGSVTAEGKVQVYFLKKVWLEDT